MLQNQIKEEKRKRRVSEVQLRTTKCYKCIHCKAEDDMRKMCFTKSLCGITGRWGSQERAFWCLDYEIPNYDSDLTEYHGYKIRNRQNEDWRTKSQWMEAGYYVKPGEKPTMMFKDFRYAEDNNVHGLFGYYLPRQVERIIKKNVSHKEEAAVGRHIKPGHHVKVKSCDHGIKGRLEFLKLCKNMNLHPSTFK